ncbi:L,D-transpeptidase family protein [Henriciella aquimarina]|uniref:L,D-transpeptidase family protein n=1 Tax=Henriciella aquimarina TaxID=545261 RepID=UPI001302059A|nr:L,D-transpeptidase family protein [Henriciella aquimarina]
MAVTSPMARAIKHRMLGDSASRQPEADIASQVNETVRRAYTQSAFEPIWSEDGAVSLMTLADHLPEYGLAPDTLPEADLRQLAEQRFQSESPETRASADIALSKAWLRLTAAVSGGWPGDKASAPSPQQTPAYAVLPQQLKIAGEGNAEKALKSFEPTAPQYVALKQALAEYRAIRDNGGWLAIPSLADGEIIEAGDTDPRIPAIRERLAVESYDADRNLFNLVNDAIKAGQSDEETPVSSAAAASEIATVDVEEAQQVLDPQRYDETLVEAVKTFQSRHGIKSDGVVGPNTLAAMNESVDSKIVRISESMDRWRKQGAMSERYIWANIPSYTAEGWKDGQREITVRTIVGTPEHETPAFNDEVEYAVANPRWYTPASIVRNEKAPKLANDPGYAQRSNFKVIDRATGQEVSAYSVNWKDASAAENYRLVQMPGANNALGELKIIFPNQYAIYLHGTPGKHLFDRAERAFSHGCIRLENPTEMAGWIAGLDSTTEADTLKQTVASKTRQKFEFKTRVPIHITYMTVTVNDDGSVNFWRDIYNRTGGIEQTHEMAPLDNPDSLMQTAKLEQG